MCKVHATVRSQLSVFFYGRALGKNTNRCITSQIIADAVRACPRGVYNALRSMKSRQALSVWFPSNALAYFFDARKVYTQASTQRSSERKKVATDAAADASDATAKTQGYRRAALRFLRTLLWAETKQQRGHELKGKGGGQEVAVFQTDSCR